MKHSILIIGIILLTINSVGQKTNPSFKKGEKLEVYYPLDSIKNIFITNLKGRHRLSANKSSIFINKLKNYIFDGDYSKTKPSHAICKIIFLNRTSLSFYVNSESDLIVNNNGDKTFISNEKLNLENY